MKKTQRKMVILVIIVLFIISGVSVVNSNRVVGEKQFFTLNLSFFQEPEHADYEKLIKLSLAKIGINAEIIIMGRPYWGGVIPIHNLRSIDLAILELQSIPEYVNPDFTGIYNENGTLNIFGYHTSMDWNETHDTGQNEWYMDQGKLIMPPNSEEKIKHYWEWENYLMEDLLLCQPLFNKRSYVQAWDTLVGYNYSKGIIQSWGDMFWSGLHLGQINTSELVIGDHEWTDLNSLLQSNSPLQDFSSSKFISSAIIDPLFWIDSNCSIKPHLATNYSMLNDTHVRINLREGINWQSDRDGNFTNEYFDAEDVYFSLYCWKNYPIIDYGSDYQWIKEMKIINPYTIDIYVDGNPNTPENEPYHRFLDMLSAKMLPEHYLNQTQVSEGVPDREHLSWDIFNTNCFGTGLFRFDSYINGTETVLTINPDCWWLNNSITTDLNLNWQQRFGDFTNILQTLRIKIMPSSINPFLFRDGELDISSELETKPSDNSDIQTYSKRMKSMSFLSYNVRETRAYIGNNEPCISDPSITKGLAVRKAISYAIDRIEMNDIVHGGEYFVTDYPIYEALGIWCNPNIIRYDHDLEKAKYYMELAGYPESFIAGYQGIEVFVITGIVFIIILNRKQKQIKNNS